MAYVFYFLGFVLMYRVSENFAEEDKKNVPIWFHSAVGLIWPIVMILYLLSEIKDMVLGVPNED
mgnify:CR=1 FL=1